jgi:hypothetical protein
MITPSPIPAAILNCHKKNLSSQKKHFLPEGPDPLKQALFFLITGDKRLSYLLSSPGRGLTKFWEAKPVRSPDGRVVKYKYKLKAKRGATCETQALVISLIREIPVVINRRHKNGYNCSQENQAR